MGDGPETRQGSALSYGITPTRVCRGQRLRVGVTPLPYPQLRRRSRVCPRRLRLGRGAQEDSFRSPDGLHRPRDPLAALFSPTWHSSATDARTGLLIGRKVTKAMTWTIVAYRSASCAPGTLRWISLHA